MNRLRRRAFLGALGGATGLALLPSRAARGQAQAESGRPLRFVAVYTPHGRAHELWQPGPNFDLRYPECVLSPFDDAATYGRSFRDRLWVIDGVDLSAGIAVGTTGHEGPRAILTGSGANGKNASLDQFLAFERGLGADTPHSALVLGVGDDRSGLGSNVSYAPGGTPVPKWIDPSHTFDELFGAALGGKRGEELARERRLGKSVLDAVRSDLGRLSARAPRSERVKLELHGHALREIEKRLTAESPRCALPPAPDRARFPKLKAFGGGERYFDAITDLQIDLMARALSCDLTRFATLFLGDLSHSRLIEELPPDIHNDVAHRYDARGPAHPGKPETWHALGLQNRYTYSKIARLLQRLGEGGVLDDTIVYVSGDMGDPNRHSSRSVPTLIAGGAGGRFREGRYLDLRSSAGGGVPNNRILVSICQAFGLPLERFGHAVDAKLLTGRLEELHAPGAG